MQIYYIVGTLSENHMLKRKSDDLEYERSLFVSMWFSGFVWSFLAEYCKSHSSRFPFSTQRTPVALKEETLQENPLLQWFDFIRHILTAIFWESPKYKNPFFCETIGVSRRNAVCWKFTCFTIPLLFWTMEWIYQYGNPGNPCFLSTQQLKPPRTRLFDKEASSGF